MTRLLPLLWIASVAFASTAHAEPTKVALAIEGDSSSIGVRKAVVNAFDAEDDLQFVSAQKTTRAIEQLGIGEVHTAKDAKTVAKKLEVAAVVQGEFDESDHTLTLIVFANGKKPGSFTVEADDTKSPSFKKNVRKRMFAKLDGATNADSSVDDDATSGGEDIKAKAGKKGSKSAAKADKKHGNDDDEVADDKADKKSKNDKADKKHGDDDVADGDADKKSRKTAGKDSKKRGKADKKHSDDDEDVASDKADKKSGKSSDKSDKKTGNSSDKSDKQHSDDDEDVAADKADKKHGKNDKNVAADKKTGKSGDKSDKKPSDDEDVASDKADKKHGHDDEDVASDKADKKSGHDDDTTSGKKSGKKGDKDVVSDKADKKKGKDDSKADKKHGRDDEDIASEKAGKSGKNSDTADKKHGHDDDDIASENADKKHAHDDDAADDKANKAAKIHDDEDDDSGEADARSGSKRAAGEDGDEEDPTTVHAAAPHDAPVAERNFAALRVDLGASMMGRSLRFQSSAVDGAPSDYHAKPVPGGHFAGELYPLAFGGRHRAIAGLGIGGDFDQARSFTIPTTDGFASERVIERSYTVGARFRIAFGHHDTSPTLTLGAGYGTRTFATDHSTGMTTGVPDVAYRMVVPSMMLRLPLGSRVTAFVGGRGMLMLSAGPITNADQYGRANAMGGTATAGVEVGLASHVALRVAAEGTQVNLKFYGQGTLSAMLDGDPSTVDVQRARDRYYGGDATIAVTY